MNDLVHTCKFIGELAAEGELVYAINETTYAGNEDWKLDLAMGPPMHPLMKPGPMQIARAKPASVWIAVEAKTIMTKHTGARKNRRRDIGAFRDFMDNYETRAVRGTIAVVNMAKQFKSQLVGKKVTPHPDIERIVEEIAAMYRNVPLRSVEGERGTVDANCIIVVDYDNIDLNRTALVTRKPAPQEGDPLHYLNFLRRICDSFERRWRSR